VIFLVSRYDLIEMTKTLREESSKKKVAPKATAKPTPKVTPKKTTPAKK
tara:strand:+ start:781 stop:927 length:147 start_codon:yes stop_codon:yes gene_type:complete